MTFTSTLSKEMNIWLGKKIETKLIYLGAGDGSKNLFARAIDLISMSKKKITNSKKNGIKKYKKQPNNSIGFIKSLILSLNIISIVYDNYRTINKMHKYRLNGGYSITDRYPQLQQMGINDGPKISILYEKAKTNYLKELSKIEAKILKRTVDIKPDLIFRLNISTETSMKRKPEQNNYKYFEEKTKKVAELKFPDTLIFEINAEKDLAEILLQIKEIIWEYL
ncbi:MAG: hypothetical protein RBT15_08930 [Gudongella sp.]|nr:hypothetical protein [Gudongella sp.]